MPQCHRRGAFTLIEVVVALVIGSLVVAYGRMILAGVMDANERAIAAAADMDRRANGERLLRSLVGQIRVDTGYADRFGGDERHARFSTWCHVPAGWLEPCRVELAIAPGDRSTLAAILSTGDSLALLSGLTSAELRYLRTASGGGQWFRVWGASLSVPLAIGVLTGADTLVIRLGDRQ